MPIRRRVGGDVLSINRRPSPARGRRIGWAAVTKAPEGGLKVSQHGRETFPSKLLYNGHATSHACRTQLWRVNYLRVRVLSLSAGIRVGWLPFWIRRTGSGSGGSRGPREVHCSRTHWYEANQWLLVRVHAIDVRSFVMCYFLRSGTVLWMCLCVDGVRVLCVRSLSVMSEQWLRMSKLNRF